MSYIFYVHCSWQMNFHTKISFLSILITFNIYAQKDSAKHFKIDAGVSYTNWINTSHNNYKSISHYSYYERKINFSDTNSFSPTLKLCFTRQFSKNIHIYLSETYHFSSIHSSLQVKTGENFNSSEFQADSRIRFHHFTTSIGSKINIRHLFLIPQAQFIILPYTEKIKEYGSQLNSGQYSEINNSISKNVTALGYGLGLATGYEISIRDHLLSLEINCNYNFLNKQYPQYFCLSGMVGFQF
ncbi:MAG: hypothetical protein L6Q66_08935 [Bacteroidia bacterium]|nr:hypothetical protein [Bacteroidia bacterium]